MKQVLSNTDHIELFDVDKNTTVTILRKRPINHPSVTITLLYVVSMQIINNYTINNFAAGFFAAKYTISTRAATLNSYVGRPDIVKPRRTDAIATFCAI